MMKILIDTTGISLQKTGTGIYARNLLNHLTLEAGPLEFFILAQDDDQEMDFSRQGNVTMLWVPARFFRLIPLRILLEQIYLPLLLLKYRIDVLHSLHYAFPLMCIGTRRVVTFHDMTFFNMPEVHERLHVLYFRFFMWASVRMVDHIIFVSTSAFQDCTRRLGPVHGKATVIPHGKGEEFRPNFSPEEIQSVREKYNIGSRFVLYVGTIEPRKNLPRLVDAFAAIADIDSEIQLVIAGKLGWMADSLFDTIKRLGLASRIVFTGYLSEQEKCRLLASCTVFVYPSLYEGFGLPALEALASGAPTITSNNSSLPEVVGDAALLVDPTSTEELQTTLNKLLSDSSLQEELRRTGPIQASKFTWRNTAHLTLEVYTSFIHKSA